MENETKEIFKIEIPFDTTIFDWTRSEKGKSLVFPELLIGCEELVYGNIDKVHCLTVITYESGLPEEIDFVVRTDGIDRVLHKILEWSIENEYYENECVRVRELQNILNSRKVTELIEIDNQQSQI